VTLAERLLAGEHHGCASWAEAARKLGCDERHLRVVRKSLAGKGYAVGLTDRDGNGHAVAALPERESTKIETQASDFHGSKWRNVEQFDAEQRMATVGESTLYDADGNIKLVWVKTKAARDPLVDIAAAFATIKDELPTSDIVIAPSIPLDDDLCATYLMGDCHVGLYAWGPEAGENYDLEIAERNLTGLVDHLVDLAPSAANALIINIGDYFHSDNRSSTTTAGTPVDVDGRWAKVLAAGIRIMRRNIDRALQKHQHVTVINEIGNHDTHTSVFLSLALAQFYENQPRVTIDVSPEMFHWFRFGSVLVGSHHGHTVKPKDLPLVMANDRAQDWGETVYRYFYGGHIHHERVIEFPGCIFESLRSPASSDAWHRGQGYRSGHDIKMDVLHRKYGRISRCIVDVPRMLGRAA
jgi:hypothetical protein